MTYLASCDSQFEKACPSLWKSGVQGACLVSGALQAMSSGLSRRSKGRPIGLSPHLQLGTEGLQGCAVFPQAHVVGPGSSTEEAPGKAILSWSEHWNSSQGHAWGAGDRGLHVPLGNMDRESPLWPPML